MGKALQTAPNNTVKTTYECDVPTGKVLIAPPPSAVYSGVSQAMIMRQYGSDLPGEGMGGEMGGHGGTGARGHGEGGAWGHGGMRAWGHGGMGRWSKGEVGRNQAGRSGQKPSRHRDGGARGWRFIVGIENHGRRRTQHTDNIPPCTHAPYTLYNTEFVATQHLAPHTTRLTRCARAHASHAVFRTRHTHATKRPPIKHP
jgi:hypothetical protein